MKRSMTLDFYMINGDDDVLEGEFKQFGLEFEKVERTPGSKFSVYTVSADEETLVTYLEEMGFEPTGPNNTWEWN